MALLVGSSQMHILDFNISMKRNDGWQCGVIIKFIWEHNTMSYSNLHFSVFHIKFTICCCACSNKGNACNLVFCFIVVGKIVKMNQQWLLSDIINICMFCLIRLIGVVCHVSKVLSTYDMSFLENIFCFAPWFKNIAFYQIIHFHYYMRLCKHFGIHLHKL